MGPLLGSSILFCQQCVQHGIRHELVAGVIEMYLVYGQDPGFFIAGIVSQVVGMEGLAEIDEPAMKFLRKVERNLPLSVHPKELDHIHFKLEDREPDVDALRFPILIYIAVLVVKLVHLS